MTDAISQTVRFDRSLLPPSKLEFVVVADTHYMIDVGDAPVEFESRRRQGSRAGAAWSAIAGLDPTFVVHMGDMVHEFPGRPEYGQTVREALAQITDAGLWERCRFVVGNHDIGDRPDPTMPTGEATGESLDLWVERHGPSWHSWDAAGLHFLVLNSQLFNSHLEAAGQQRAWFETRLAEVGHEPCVLFLHMPPYLHDAAEPWLGHYDNLGEPDRGWLLDLVRRHQVVAMFTGHVHFQFFDHVAGDAGHCRYFVTPSTSFTRPGFSHLFTSSSPPEQGRDDVPKLGFFLCRQVDDRLDVHRVRLSAVPSGDAAYLLNPLPTVSAASERAAGFELGVTLRHELAPEVEVPAAFPSRQPVRNDYPLLSCLELGVTCVRTPVADLADPTRARRLGILRAEGSRVQAFALGEAEALARAHGLRGVDHLEVQLPGRALPDVDALRPLAEAGLPLVLTAVMPGQPVPGKQHHRTRIGFVADELAELGRVLDDVGVPAAAACRLDPWASWEEAIRLAEACRRRRWQLQLLAELPGVDEIANAAAVARALLIAAALDAPVFLEPLIDLDRTMDVAHGLLDTRCNPRLAFDVARSLTALVKGAGALGAALSVAQRGPCEVAALGERCCLVITDAAGCTLGEAVADLATADDLRVCRLAFGTIADFDPQTQLAPEAGPLFVYRPAGAR